MSWSDGYAEAEQAEVERLRAKVKRLEEIIDALQKSVWPNLSIEDALKMAEAREAGMSPSWSRLASVAT
jgi:hypothetical protein